MLESIVEYKKLCKEAEDQGEGTPQITNYIARCIMLICENLSNLRKFNGYTFKEEMVLDGVENCIRYFHNFDPNKSGNPFAYFTQIAYYAFIRRIQREKTQLYAKYKYTERIGLLDEYQQLGDEDHDGKQFEMYENMSEFIEKFEQSQEKKKIPKKKKNLENFIEESIPDE